MKKIKNIVVIGCGGALGNSFLHKLSEKHSTATIRAYSRQLPDNMLPGVLYDTIDCGDEKSIEKAVRGLPTGISVDLVIVTIGILHNSNIMPEKSLKDLSAEKFQLLFEVNTIMPALIAKYFLPKLNRDAPSFFAALSARVGSISDNQLGGWYAYRASKAALNMVVKCAAIEVGRFNKQATIVGLHPGTVDSDLSKPFQGNVPDGKLFSSDYAAEALLSVLESLSPIDSGKCFAWDGQEILP